MLGHVSRTEKFPQRQQTPQHRPVVDWRDAKKAEPGPFHTVNVELRSLESWLTSVSNGGAGWILRLPSEVRVLTGRALLSALPAQAQAAKRYASPHRETLSREAGSKLWSAPQKKHMSTKSTAVRLSRLNRYRCAPSSPSLNQAVASLRQSRTFLSKLSPGVRAASAPHYLTG